LNRLWIKSNNKTKPQITARKTLAKMLEKTHKYIVNIITPEITGSDLSMFFNSSVLRKKKIARLPLISAGTI